MSEQLSEDEKKQIEELLRQWEMEIEESVETIPFVEGRLDGARTKKRVELERNIQK